MICNVTYLRSVAGLSDQATETDLEPHLDAASLRLARWVGREAYADAENASPVDADRAKALKLAEAHLAASSAITPLATHYSGEGLVGGASLTEGQASYLTPRQAAELAASHLAEAQILARPYLLSPAAAGALSVEPGDV